MSLVINVCLKSDIEFTSRAQQEKLREEIDKQTFIIPKVEGESFISNRARTTNQVSIKGIQVSSFTTDVADEVGEIVADFFDTEVEWVQISES